MTPQIFYSILIAAAAIIAVVTFFKCIRIVPAKQAWVVERLGKYSSTLEAGFHVLVPFIDKVRYKHSLKEKALDVPVQPCFTEDNVRIFVDGVLYLQVVDPVKASYGITKALRTPGLKDYEYATVQLAQTMMRSVIGKMQLDTTFEERGRPSTAPSCRAWTKPAIPGASRSPVTRSRTSRCPIPFSPPWKNRCRRNGKEGPAYWNRKVP